MELSITSEEQVCAAPCCGARPRWTASELCERGLRRNRQEPFAIAGTAARNRDGLVAQFSVQRHGPWITSVRFKASTCATLLAYCELTAELASECSIAECAALGPHLLISELPDIPAAKRDRAFLAATAFRSALARLASSEAMRVTNEGILLGRSA